MCFKFAFISKVLKLSQAKKTMHGRNKQEESMKNDKAYYYIDEKGNLVFTEKYHLKRGYCCENGCRHCPYGFKKKQ